MVRHVQVLVLLLGLGGCGGGGSGQPGPGAGQPFGLTARPSLALVNLPATGGLGEYVLVNAFPNLSFPGALFLTGVPGDNRLVVVEQSGLVAAFVNQPDSAASRIVLDLTARVLFAGEQGLLGLAFDPDFVDNRYVYVYYSLDGPRRSVVARFTWNAATDLIDPGSEKVLLEVEQPFANHNGGMLAFGPDDMLYIALGDGGSGGDPLNNAQDTANLLGSLLRIDVHPNDPADPYDIPLGNPLFGDPDSRGEIWAFGLRNPFRFSFDRQSGDLWLGDVGQNEIEEVDLITAGGNYGWRVFEGTRPFNDSLNDLPDDAFTPPVIEYDHSQGVSVIGGYVYRGARLSSLFGRYLYSDFGSGTVWALQADGSDVLSNVEIATADRPTSFGEDNDGEVYVVGRNAGIFRFEETGEPQPVPELLSQTGLFTDAVQLAPASGLIEYGVAVADWSDGTIRRRWIGVPDAGRISFDALGAWQFPIGTVLVQHVEIQLTEGDPLSARRLETRVLLLTAQGWQGYTYRWVPDQTDAQLLAGRETETLIVALESGDTQEQTYEYPSRADCLACHTSVAGSVLGARTRQLNRNFDYVQVTDNQLRSLNNIGLFTTDIGSAGQYDHLVSITDSAADLEQRARTYLHVNCAHCHQPGGPTPVLLDLRLDTPLADAGLVGVLPLAGDLGIAGARLVQPGDRESSVLWQRLRATDAARMPPLSSHLVDQSVVTLVGDWIDALP